MFNSQILDVIIGLIFVYALLALCASALLEAVESASKSRGRLLRDAITEMIGFEAARAVYQHPSVSSLYRGEYVDRPLRNSRDLPFTARSLPSYIPPRSFAHALLDVTQLAPAPSGANASSRAARLCEIAMRTALRDRTDVVTQLELRFTECNDRLSGRYKRRAQAYLTVIASALTLSLNASTVSIAEQLHGDATLRSALVARSVPVALAGLDSLRAAGLALGYPEQVQDFASWWSHMREHAMGFLLTTLAISLGAPLWFDLLGRTVPLRAARKLEHSDSNGQRPIVVHPLPAASVPASRVYAAANGNGSRAPVSGPTGELD